MLKAFSDLEMLKIQTLIGHRSLGLDGQIMQMEIFGTISVSERVYLMASALLAETPCLSVAQVLRVMRG